MRTLQIWAANIFSPNQTVLIVLLSVLLVLLLAAIGVLIYLLKKRGERKLHTQQLQSKREALLAQLDAMRAGTYVGSRGETVTAEEEEPEDAETDEDEADDDEEEEGASVEVLAAGDDEEGRTGTEILPVKKMSALMREKFGFMDAEYDPKRYYVRYNYSFEAKLRASDDEVKARYMAFADEVSQYTGLKISRSFRQERIYKGRKTLGLILFRGKTLCIAFALDPAAFADTKYRGIDKSDKKRFQKTPMLYKLTSTRKSEYAKYLLFRLAEENMLGVGEPHAGEYDLAEMARNDLFAAQLLRITVLGEVPDDVPWLEDEDILVEETEEPEEEEEEIAADEEPDDASEEEVTADGVTVRYNRSFTARITQGSDEMKARYSELKNYLLSYEGVRDRMSWKRETFRKGRASLTAFSVRGKTLCLNLALDPEPLIESKYRVRAARSKTSKLPSLFRITSDRKVRYAKELIDTVMANAGISKQADYKAADFTLPYRTTEVLVRRGLIKVIGGAVPTFAEEEAAASGVRYNRSFTARITQSDDVLKARYSELKNYLLSYEGVRDRMSWKRETFRKGRETPASLTVRGKTLCMTVAVDPARLENTKYKVAAGKNGTSVYRIKSDRKLKYAKELADMAMTDLGAVKTERTPENYAVPYRSTDALVRHGLIRVTAATPFRRPPAKKQ